MPREAKVLVINPNSNADVTGAISEAMEPLRLPGRVAIECVTMDEGPFGVETQEHIEQVKLPLKRMMMQRSADCDAFVIACYSDPGIEVCREATGKPVFGIQESGFLAAMSRGNAVGVIALSNTAINRHLRYLRALGVIDRLARERPLGLSVADSERPEAFNALAECGRLLRDEDGADVILLGCAGMARHRKALSQDLALSVIDPVQAAVADAVGAVLLE